MSYRNKTPSVISILKRKLKPGKRFEDFQQAHIPGKNAKKNEFGYEVDFFGVPTRVINAVSAEDTTIVYSIGLSYGTVDKVFQEAMRKSKEDEKSGGRGDKLDEVCDDLAPPVIAFVASDNDYGGDGEEYIQSPLPIVTPDVTRSITMMLNKKSDSEEKTED